MVLSIGHPGSQARMNADGFVFKHGAVFHALMTSIRGNLVDAQALHNPSAKRLLHTHAIAEIGNYQ
ncbi:hypothetical protein K227x_36250 [Rubripirellula lacrimiformis]|uniref:Uncharacterized protein n=1 Tax=Rubripirellula lacrimiformis TaxID=1930273 RepID=A0A517NDN1_9BACT|nr:hypothetical protein K227x_36250 [Rubripirellula lacrimiformis]